MTIHTRTDIAIDLLCRTKELHANGNLISAIVLAGAAQQILRDLNKSKSNQPTIKTLADIDNCDGKALHNLIVETYNKLKHADEDQDDVEVLDDDLKVLVSLAVTDLLRLNPVCTEVIKSIVDFQICINMTIQKTITV